MGLIENTRRPLGPPPDVRAAIGDIAFDLTITVDIQRADNWCWAATTAAVRNHFVAWRNELTQCAVAGRRLGRDCCGAGAANCDVQSGLTLPLHEQHCFGRTIVGQIAFAEIAAEVAAGRPVCARVVWDEGRGDGHFVVIDGVSEATGEIALEDSFHGPLVTTFDAFRRGYVRTLHQDGKPFLQSALWTHTYLTRSPAGSETAV